LFNLCVSDRAILFPALLKKSENLFSPLGELFNLLRGNNPYQRFAVHLENVFFFFHVCPESLRQVADLANGELRSSESISLRPSWLLLFLQFGMCQAIHSH
jgi:hypothetical protein